jgi:alkylation response protein AidB-like acyl-CoA dehydrogenase
METTTPHRIRNINDLDDIVQTLASGVEERDRTGTISSEVFDTLRASGLTSILVPEECGGGGATFADTGQLLRQLARYDASTAVTVSMHTHLVAAQVWRYRHGIAGPEAVFDKVTSGAMLISTGASDWLASSGVARRVEGGYRVSATKGPASGCEVGQILVTSVRWDDAPDGNQVIHCAVPFEADGVRIEHTWDTMGLRATGSDTVVLEDVFVPDAAVSLIRPADCWHPVWNTVLGVAMPLIMAAYLGIADAALEHARAAASKSDQPHTRQLLGETINAHTIARDVVAAMFADADDLRFDNTNDYASLTLSRKTVAADATIQTVRLTLELVGGAGYCKSHEVERLLRDVHGCLFHPLSRSRQIAFSANVAVGEPPID